jgi:hypothetical protein
MSVAYEPRNFIHEGKYPPIGDEHDHTAGRRFPDTDVAEQLSQYTAEAALLLDDQAMDDEARMLSYLLSDHEHKEPSPDLGSPPSPRSKHISKPARDVIKQADGRFHCRLEDCKEDIRAFARKCEWK